MTPTARSLAVLRELGYTVQVVEQWNNYSKTRQDLFGVIDVLAVHPEYGIVGIQATTTGNAAARQTKALAEERLVVWLQGGGHFEVWGWALRGKAGARKLWTLSRRRVRLVDGELEVETVDRATTARAGRSRCNDLGVASTIGRGQ